MRPSASLRLAAALLAACPAAFAQFQSADETPYAGYSTPTGIDRADFLVFEARPIVSYPFYDNMKDRFQNAKRIGQTYALTFDPQIRMYNSNSVPVRMPSYRVFLSGTVGWIDDTLTSPHNITSLTLQHGHYSDGQEGCAFGTSDDNDSLCKDKYANLGSLDLEKEVNRRSGEFSTDFWRLKVKHLWFGYQEDGKREKTALELTGTGTYLVNRMLFFADVGGYKSKDADFYPMWQLGAEAAVHHFCRGTCVDMPLPWPCTDRRLRFGSDWKLTMEYYFKHSDSPQIPEQLFAPSAMLFLENGLGFEVRGEFGQDPYNLHLVDSLRRGIFAFVWHLSTPWQLEKSTQGQFGGG